MTEELVKVTESFAGRGAGELIVLAAGLGALILFGNLLLILLKRYKTLLHTNGVDECSEKIKMLEHKVRSHERDWADVSNEIAVLKEKVDVNRIDIKVYKDLIEDYRNEKLKEALKNFKPGDEYERDRKRFEAQEEIRRQAEAPRRT